VFVFLSKVLSFLNFLVVKFLVLFKKKNSKVEKRINEIFIQAIFEVKSLSQKNKFFYIPFYSVIIWLSLYSMLYFFMNFVGIKINYFNSLLASSGAVLTTVLPINGLGNFGTLEAGWTIGYTIIGISKNNAISTAFTLHIIILIAGFIFSIIVFAFLIIDNNKTSK
jgi:uncharacterized membrane protein YbhN (UPF0104 family)